MQSSPISACAGDAVYSNNLTTILFDATQLYTDLKFETSANFQVSLDGINFSGTTTMVQNGGKASGIAYIRTTALPSAGSASGWLKISSDIRFSTVNLTTTVSPLPTINPVPNQTLTAGAVTTTIALTGNAKAYSWTNNTPAIGIPAYGEGDIPSFTALNPGGGTLTATITATPKNVGYVYVANTYGNSISVINPIGNYVAATIPVGMRPLKAIVSPDNNWVYVINNESSSISIISTSNNTVAANVPLGSKPVDIYVMPGSDFLYVTTASNTVVRVNLTLRSVYDYLQLDVGAAESYMSPDGSHYYVSSPAKKQVTVINTNGFTIEAIIPNMDNAYRFVTSHDGSRLYISDLSANTVTVINTATNAKIATIQVSGYPVGLVLSPDGKRLYTAGTNSSTISVINTVTNSVIETISVSTGPIGLSISPDGSTLYSAGYVSQSVSIVSTLTNAVTDNIPVPGIQGYQSLSQDGKYLYILDMSNRFANVINTATKTVVGKAAVGIFPALYDRSISSGTGCVGSPVTFTITVKPAPPPTVTVNGSLSGVNTYYGISSPTRSVTVSASAGPLVVTPPPGFEVSADNLNFSSTVNIGQIGGFSSLPVYIRLAAITDAGTYSGNIVISHPQISTSVSMPNSVVSPALLTLTATDVTKRYGELLTDNSASNEFSITTGSLKNGNTIVSAAIVYGTGKNPVTGVGTYSNAVTITGVDGANGFLAGNYALTYKAGSITITPAELIITANNASKIYGGVAPADPGFTVSGLQNNETVSTVNYTYNMGALATDNVGTYLNAITPSLAAGTDFVAANYNIIYKGGTFTITPAVLTVTVANATKHYGNPNPAFSATYVGFVNGQTEWQISQLPVITSSATIYSQPGEYPITASGASAANYTFIYVDGVLSITSAAAVVIPNAFTPNNDGINDNWNVTGLIAYPDCIVEIYNRYGQKVYHSVGYSTPWDGTTKGVNTPAGVYYYVIYTKRPVSRMAGSLTVIR